jgi:truncated hemoglobin YjbI
VTAFEAIGGEPVLRTIISVFVGRMISDTMIGFFFTRVDRRRLEEMEYRFTARFLGADVEYTGLPIRDAHAKHPIMGGQFDRRRRILEEVLVEYGIDDDTRRAWLGHVDTLRPLVTRDAAGTCDEALASRRIGE